MKKYLLSLGALSVIAIPIATTVACGSSNSNNSSNHGVLNSYGYIPEGKTIKGYDGNGKPYYGSIGESGHTSKNIIGFTDLGFPIFDFIDGNPVVGYTNYYFSTPILEKDIEIHLPTTMDSFIVRDQIEDFINSNTKDYFQKYDSYSTVMDESKYGNHNAFIYQSNPMNTDGIVEAMPGYFTIATTPLGYAHRIWVTINIHEYMIWLVKNQDKYSFYFS